MKHDIQFLSDYFKIVLVLFIISSCHSHSHFITDKYYRKQVKTDFEIRKKMANNRAKELFTVFDDKKLTLKEKEALEFLYAYMPLSDLADYDGSFFLNQVRYAFKAQNEMPWGKDIPEEIFRHFVLVYRVNNENLDTARYMIFDLLKDRIKKMSMNDAALEINHWCHEKVSYRPADSRTSAPLATIRTGFGRCGEESTLAVTAMRAMGIPARQCYTPRWAHCDDNHAWVEVWGDGKWHYLGACEPEPKLDMAWFSIPATRAMMVHCKVFGKYKNLSECNLITELYAVVNMLSNYTDTKKIRVIVTDLFGTPIKDATVKFKLYNYAEYFSLASINTDENGVGMLTTGYGDLLLWASKNGKFGYQKIDVRLQDETTIIIENEPGREYIEFFEMIPPEARPIKIEVTQEQEDINNKCLQYEDSLRFAYLNTFMKEDKAKTIISENLTSEQVWMFINKSEGNYEEMAKFIKQNSVKKSGLFVFDFLKSLSNKDLCDAPADILQDHITVFHPEKYPFDVYAKGILPARIANEGLVMWRNYLHCKLIEDLEINPTISQLISWMNKNITLLPDDNYYLAPISPKGVYELKLTDNHSRNIFFVAACRALNFPAYLDGASNQVFVWEKEMWNIVDFEQNKEPKMQKTESLNYSELLYAKYGTKIKEEGNTKTEVGKLILNTQKEFVKPEYWTQYTIAKYVDGDFVTFDYEEDPRIEIFPATLCLEPGYYMLSTGNRYSDGETLSRLEFFNIEPEKTINKQITIRELVARNKKYGEIDANYKIDIMGKYTSIIEFMPEKELIVSFIDPTREPTKHLLNDIERLKRDFEKWGGKILLLIPPEKYTATFDLKNYNFPENVICSIDNNSNFLKYILSSTKQDFKDAYPLLFIISKEGSLTFKSEGYRIGTGELLLKSL